MRKDKNGVSWPSAFAYIERPITPDTPSEAEVRRKLDEELRQRYGQAWLDANKHRLDLEWEFVKTCGIEEWGQSELAEENRD